MSELNLVWHIATWETDESYSWLAYPRPAEGAVEAWLPRLPQYPQNAAFGKIEGFVPKSNAKMHQVTAGHNFTMTGTLDESLESETLAEVRPQLLEVARREIRRAEDRYRSICESLEIVAFTTT